MADEYTPVEINELPEKETPVDADNLILENSADSNKWRKLAISNLSLKAQVDLIANSTNYNALGILMKGYKEYTFAIRQSGTDAPTIYVIKDDFELDTALTFSYANVGRYGCDVSNLITQLSERWNYSVSGAKLINTIDSSKNMASVFLDTESIDTYDIININTAVVDMTADTYTLANNILSNANGVTISIRETLDTT